MYLNNSIVTITDIGVGDNALFCLSNSSSCCRNRDGIASGEWFLPGESSPINGSGSFSTDDFSRIRRSSAVLLNRRNNALGPEGLHRCDVIDEKNIDQTLYIGINQGKHKLILFSTYVNCSDFVFQIRTSLVFLLWLML